ncbi:hypothetical protein SAMN04244560_00335 [Thermoanaerobacter thermohydrosulfuricus]|uniref:TrbC/VIRB2 family protein n=1 Tax=Thermoanaerobacter thermohydrosulfuricus TaxID=1516 RepID=A0A1G7IVE3_THETY|nr:hypothetical protein [Thermoanaerobacter thermohydrosulfuricus]SDF16279.1 hypothetical protein SAMN04244560_00335 [Thermoanaerobacter thermohydrosulfuricus]
MSPPAHSANPAVQEFAAKIAQSLTILAQALGSIIIPLATVMMIVSIIMFIFGSIFHSSNIKKAGAAGMISVAVGILLYYAIPTIMGILQAMSAPFK